MNRVLVPVLWLCGPPAVGKTAIGWEIFSHLTRCGVRTGYVDIDQLGIYAPESTEDLGNHRMKARNLDAVLATFRASGARCVVVSGVVHAVQGVHIDQIPLAALTVCRLRASHDELRSRLAVRGWQPDLVDAVLREADLLDRSGFAGVCVDTSGLDVTEATGLVLARTGGWPMPHGRPMPSGCHSAPTPPADRPTGDAAGAAGGPILWLCGATGVGKSTVGWRIWEDVRHAGIPAGFIDLDQVAFCEPTAPDDPDNHRIKARNLAAIWRTYRASGAACLVVVGPVRHPGVVRIYTDALPAVTVTLCRLHAGRRQLTRRIMLRGEGYGPPIPGDRLNGLATPVLHRIAKQSAAEAVALDRAGVGQVSVDTSRRTVEEIARMVVARAGGWPGLTDRES